MGVNEDGEMDESLTGGEATGGEPGGRAGRVLVDCGEPALAGAGADEHVAGAETTAPRADSGDPGCEAVRAGDVGETR
ncbi:MAG TPA: hypothetical protein VGA70_08180, partial [Longimicrobiales bacterium]